MNEGGVKAGKKALDFFTASLDILQITDKKILDAH